MKSITATMVEQELGKFSKRKSRRPLFLIINSRGGDLYAMLKIRGLLKQHERLLVTVVFGKAYSGALTLFELGALRLMTKKSLIRFHQANHNFVKDETLNAADMMKRVAELHGIDAIQKLIYLERISPASTPIIKKLGTLFIEEAYLDYRQAKEIKMVDAVIPQQRSVDALVDYLIKKIPDPFLEALEELGRLQ